MPQDPTISDLQSLFDRPDVGFGNGLSRTDNDVTQGHASEINNFEIKNGVACRRNGSTCMSNPKSSTEGTLKWRAFHETTISGARVLLGITQTGLLKAFLAHWPEVEFPVYRKGLNPMNYQSLAGGYGAESYEVRFERGEKFWMDNEDNQYLKIINNYGDAIRIDKRGYVQVMKTRDFGSLYKPSYQMDQARVSDTDIALYMDVLDATNRDIFKFYTSEREEGDTTRIRGIVKVASVNECGVVGKLSDGVVFPESTEMLVSMIPLNAVNDGKIDLKYQGTVFKGTAEDDVAYAVRESDGTVSYADSVNSTSEPVEFYLMGRRSYNNLTPEIITVFPIDGTYELDASVFHQFPPTFNVTHSWDGQPFDLTIGTPVPIGWTKNDYNIEVSVAEFGALFGTNFSKYSVVADVGTMVGADDTAAAYTFLPWQESTSALLARFSDGDSFTLTRPSGSDGEMTFLAKGTFSVTDAATSPHKLSNPSYKYSGAVIGAGGSYGIKDIGMDIWRGVGEVNLSSPDVDIRTKKAIVDVDDSTTAIVPFDDINRYSGAGAGFSSGLGKNGRFAVWNADAILGKSQVGWQPTGVDFNFQYSIDESFNKYDKSIDDASAVGRVINQLPTGNVSTRMQCCPVMSLAGMELRQYGYVEPVIYEPIRDPSHIAVKNSRIFVVQGATMWIGSFSTLMLDTVVDIDFTVQRMEPFADGVVVFTDDGIKKISTAGKMSNVNTEQIKTEDVKASTSGGSGAYAVSELNEVFQVIMIYEGTTVPYPKAVLMSAPVYAMEWGSSPKMSYVDGTLWVGRDSDVWGFSDGVWAKQKDFTGKTIDHMFGFDNNLCVAFYDVPDITAEDAYDPPDTRS